MNKIHSPDPKLIAPLSKRIPLIPESPPSNTDIMKANTAERNAMNLNGEPNPSSPPVCMEPFDGARNFTCRKSKAVLAMICVAAAMANPAQARLGETREECQARYGAGTVGRVELSEDLQQSGRDWESAVYSARGLRIQVVFADGKAVFIKYSNNPIFDLGPGQAPTVNLSPSELTYLKTANAGAKRSWSIHTDALCKKVAPSLTVWQSSDQELHAGYNRESKELFICTKYFWDLVVGIVRKRYDPAREGDAEKRFEGL